MNQDPLAGTGNQGRFHFSPYDAVAQVVDMRRHHKIDIPEATPEHTFAVACMKEEFEEFLEAREKWDKLDAIIDLLTFAAGILAANVNYNLNEIMYQLTIHDQALNQHERHIGYPFSNLYDICHQNQPGVSFIKARKHNSSSSLLMKDIDDYAKTEQKGILCWIIFHCFVKVYMAKYQDVFKLCFMAVHEANMAKEVGCNEKRGNFPYDLVKPKGWQAPNLKQIFMTHRPEDFDEVERLKNKMNKGIEQAHVDEGITQTEVHLDIVNKTLAQRGSIYGQYADCSRVSEQLIEVLESGPTWKDAPRMQRDSMRMICHKLARVVCGDPNYADNFVDIAGYSKLVQQELEKTNANA